MCRLSLQKLIADIARNFERYFAQREKYTDHPARKFIAEVAGNFEHFSGLLKLKRVKYICF